MINLGSFLYLGMLCQGTGGLQIGLFKLLDKVTFNFVAANMAGIPANTVHDMTLTEAVSTTADKFTFAYASSGTPGNNIHFLALSLELCRTRDIYRICTLCESGYVLLGNTADNRCVKQEDVTSGWGKDIGATTQPTYRQCSITGCLKCWADYTLCSGCNPSLDQFLASLPVTPVRCMSRSLIPNGYGADTVTQKVVACASTLTNCLSCRDNYLICQIC